LLVVDDHGYHWKRKVVAIVGLGKSYWSLEEEDFGECWRRYIFLK
jgi:hypothetical protein